MSPDIRPSGALDKLRLGGKLREKGPPVPNRLNLGYRAPVQGTTLGSWWGKPGFNSPKKTGKKQASAHANRGEYQFFPEPLLLTVVSRYTLHFLIASGFAPSV